MKNRKGNILVIFLAVALVFSTVAIGYLFIQNKQLQNQIIKPIPSVQNSAPTNNFPTPTPAPTSTTVSPTVNQKTKFLIINDTYHCKDGNVVMSPNECSPSETR